MTIFARNLFQLKMFLELIPFPIPNGNFSLMTIMRIRVIQNQEIKAMFQDKI